MKCLRNHISILCSVQDFGNLGSFMSEMSNFCIDNGRFHDGRCTFSHAKSEKKDMFFLANWFLSEMSVKCYEEYR